MSAFDPKQTSSPLLPLRNSPLPICGLDPLQSPFAMRWSPRTRQKFRRVRAYAASDVPLPLSTHWGRPMTDVSNPKAPRENSGDTTLLEKLKASEAARTEAQAFQRATNEILSVISQSSTDVQPVFNMIVERAVELCGG
jgi:hypothetical protein